MDSLLIQIKTAVINHFLGVILATRCVQNCIDKIWAQQIIKIPPRKWSTAAVFTLNQGWIGDPLIVVRSYLQLLVLGIWVHLFSEWIQQVLETHAVQNGDFIVALVLYLNWWWLWSANRFSSSLIPISTKIDCNLYSIFVEIGIRPLVAKSWHLWRHYFETHQFQWHVEWWNWFFFLFGNRTWGPGRGTYPTTWYVPVKASLIMIVLALIMYIHKLIIYAYKLDSIINLIN